jgi:hypothetical protein
MITRGEPLPAPKLLVVASSMHMVMKHISPGSDVIIAIAEFAHHENICISVLSMSG